MFFRKKIKETITWLPYTFLFLLKKDFREAFERLTWDKKRLEEFQREKLQKIISWAFAKSPFYRKFYSRAGFDPEKFKDISDIQKIPILTKELLRKAINDKTIFTQKTVPPGVLKSSTTGSSGDPLTLFLDLSSRWARYFNGMRSLWLMGAFPHKKLVLIWRKKEMPLTKKVRSWLGLYKQISVVDVMKAEKTALDKENLKRIIKELISFKPQIIRGYVSALWVISKFLKKYNLRLKPEHIIASAEYLPPVWWEELEESFQCPVHNLYGGSEASPIATSLGREKELMVFSDFYFVEIVNQNGSWLKEKQTGRILVTDYYNYYMPLIRYEIGDIAQWSSRTPSPFPFFKEVQGRINDVFILPGGKILFSHNWHIYFRNLKSITKFKVIQRDVNKIDVYLETPITKWNEELEETKNKVSRSLGKQVEINWILVNKLNLDPGEKFRTVRSEIDINTILKNL